MSVEIPQLNPEILSSIEALKASPKMAKALQIAFDEAELGMKEQIELCEIPAPTFEEAKRGQDIVRRMKAYGLTDVSVDDIGNVIGFRPGKGNGPVLAIGAHMDTVFPNLSCVYFLLNCAIGSMYAAAAGETRAMKSSTPGCSFPRAISTSAGRFDRISPVTVSHS